MKRSFGDCENVAYFALIPVEIAPMILLHAPVLARSCRAFMAIIRTMEPALMAEKFRRVGWGYSDMITLMSKPLSQFPREMRHMGGGVGAISKGPAFARIFCVDPIAGGCRKMVEIHLQSLRYKLIVGTRILFNHIYDTPLDKVAVTNLTEYESEFCITTTKFHMTSKNDNHGHPRVTISDAADIRKCANMIDYLRGRFAELARVFDVVDCQLSGYSDQMLIDLVRMSVLDTDEFRQIYYG